MAGLRDALAKHKERQNGTVEKPRSIAALRAAKQQSKSGGIAAARKRHSKRVKISSKLDFNLGGILYHSARIHEGRNGRPWGEVSVTNGDRTYVFNNRYGSWMHDLHDSGRMAEPAAVAKHMGVNISQVDFSKALIERFYKQLKAEGIPTPEERLRIREEQALAERRKRKKHIDNTDD